MDFMEQDVPVHVHVQSMYHVTGSPVVASAPPDKIGPTCQDESKYERDNIVTNDRPWNRCASFCEFSDWK